MELDFSNFDTLFLEPPEAAMPKKPTTPPAGTAKIPMTKPTIFPIPLEPAAMLPTSDLTTSYPASVQDEIMDIFRCNIRSISWAANDLSNHTDRRPHNTPRGDEAAQRVLMDLSERIVRVFLQRHAFDQTAAFLTFQEEIKKKVPMRSRRYLTGHNIRKGLAHLKWYIPDISNRLQSIMARVPFSPDILAAYHSNLLKVFDEHNTTRRRKEPQLVFHLDADPQPLPSNPHDDF